MHVMLHLYKNMIVYFLHKNICKYEKQFLSFFAASFRNNG